MEKQDLLEKIRNLIKKQQLPKEIKKNIDEIYKEYYDVYQKFLSNIEGREKLKADLDYIKDYMNKDYEEDRDTTYEVGEISYLIKLDEMAENITTTINKIIDDRGICDKHNEKIQENAKTELENKKCSQIITVSIISGIDSSKKALMMRISNIEEEKNNSAIEQSKDEFSKKIDQIINKVKLELTTNIKNALNKQDITIGEMVINLYHQYIEENKQKSNNKEKFKASLHVEVNTAEVIEKGQKEPKEQRNFLEENLFND